MAKSKKPVKKTTAPKRAVVSSKTRRKPVKAKKAVKVTGKPVKAKKAVKVNRKPVKAKKAVKVTRKPVKAKKAVKVTGKPVKAKKAVKVTRKPVKAKKAVKVTKRAIKAKKIKVVNPKTGRKKTVKPVTEIKQLNLTTPQTEKFVKLKPFNFDPINASVADQIFFVTEEFNTTVTVTREGITVNVTNEQLLELVNRINTEYKNYCEKKQIKSNVARWRCRLTPEKNNVNLNLDKSFFNGDLDDPFNPSDVFFDMF